ncbi:hypothetical protein PV04_07324 [Phialophora macrospora]|uniref:Uncharacterized protein n=1 Tax=Phialophora macrospora TaxID=1851006 RepID=A0A0D2DSA6_9EURO|nr:hypothetical protein PV04_07324 [Phialophora macrospora]
MAAAEVRNGDFFYRDTLFVDLGANKCHPRASAQDLKDLLLPKSGSAPKDQVAHWYEAQLIHYGLPRSKDKNTAKVRLTNAIASKTLALPKEIVAMEGEMKKQYARALRKAKSNGGVGTGAAATSKGETKLVGSKTKKVTSTSTSKTTVELELDGMKITIDRESLAAAAKTKTPKSTAAKEDTAKPKGAKASESKPKPATAAKSAPVKAAAPGKSSGGKPAASALPASRPRSEAPKQTARRGNHSGYSVTDRPIPSSSPEKPTGAAAPKPRARQTARRGKTDPFYRTDRDRPASSPSQTYDHTPYSFQHDVDMDDAPPSYDTIDFNQPPESSSGPEDFAISGTYFFPRHPVQPFSLTLQVDERSRHLWGSFHIGSKEGVLCMDDIAGIASGQAVSFGWRSEDQHDGFMKFGRGCDGTMEFDGGGWIRGHFHGLMYGEDVEFVGNLVNEEGLDVREMKHIWDEFPRKAYGRS